jgi:hypothetical protein
MKQACGEPSWCDHSVVKLLNETSRSQWWADQGDVLAVAQLFRRRAQSVGYPYSYWPYGCLASGDEVGSDWRFRRLRKMGSVSNRLHRRRRCCL